MENLSKHFDDVARRLAEMETQLAEPDVARDSKRYPELSRGHRELSDALTAYRERERLARELAEARELLADAEMAEMARAEIDGLTERLEAADRRLRLLLLPQDANDRRNTIVEIRAGTGGEEAALFAGDLLRMYTRYAELKSWRVELLSANASDLGGFKEVIFTVAGEGTYSRLKYEGGTHRVQRVPATEAQGRIHTSAVTVAVMPEAEEVDVEIRSEDLRVEVFRSSGPGGQSVNTTDSAVRLTHVPSGLVVSCQDEKSQHKNKAKALKVLRARLFDRAQQEAHEEEAARRRSQVGSGDRSERIRTYNFPQNRLTDHRINMTLYNLDRVLEGELNAVLDPLMEQMQAELLKAL